MNYKELYDEIHFALWGSSDAKEHEDFCNEGFLIGLHDPFHYKRSSLDSAKNTEVQELFIKFANKLYLETKDEYAIKILQEYGDYVGCSFTDGDINEVCGTDMDPEFTFDEYKKEDAKEPVKNKGYIVSEEVENIGTHKKTYSEKKFFFKDDALSHIHAKYNEFKEQYDMLGEEVLSLEKESETEIIFVCFGGRYHYKLVTTE